MSPACRWRGILKMNYHHSRTSTSVLASPVEFLANRAPTSDPFRRSPRVLLSHEVHYAATSLTGWFPVAVRSMLAVTSLSVVIPSLELPGLPSVLSILPRHQQEFLHDISKDSSTTSAKFLSLPPLFWHGFGFFS